MSEFVDEAQLILSGLGQTQAQQVIDNGRMRQGQRLDANMVKPGAKSHLYGDVEPGSFVLAPRSSPIKIVLLSRHKDCGQIVTIVSVNLFQCFIKPRYFGMKAGTCFLYSEYLAPNCCAMSLSSLMASL